jgi:hypothetical protein
MSTSWRKDDRRLGLVRRPGIGYSEAASRCTVAFANDLCSAELVTSVKEKSRLTEWAAIFSSFIAHWRHCILCTASEPSGDVTSWNLWLSQTQALL